MRNYRISFRSLIATGAAVAVIGLGAFAAPGSAAYKSLPASGNSEDVIVQIACAHSSQFPMDVVLNYSNASHGQSFSSNTLDCPPAGQSLGSAGRTVRGIAGDGNLETATAFGVTVTRNGPERAIDVDHDGVNDGTARIYCYDGFTYYAIKISAD